MLILFPFLLVGSVAGGLISTLLYPFDLMKVHLQMRNELVKDPYRYRLYYIKYHLLEGLEIVQDLAKREKIRTFRVGLLPMFFLGSFGTVIRISSYQFAYKTSFLSTNNQDVLQPRSIAFCGLMGSLSQLLMNPFSLMKTKLQYWSLCQSTATFRYMREVTFYGVGKSLYKKFGTGIFTIGWGACVCRGFVASVVQLITYQTILLEVDRIDNTFIFVRPDEWDAARTFAAVIAGITSTICVCPFDVALTRLHTQPYMVNLRGIFYADLRDAMYKIAKYEGRHGYYKGAFFLFLKHGLMATSGMLFWDMWKDRVAFSIMERNGPQFVQQRIVEYIFDLMDLF